MMFIVLLVLILQWIDKTLRDRRIAKEFGWRAYKKAHNTFIYGEKYQNSWREIEIHRAYRFHYGGFYIDFKDRDSWKEYPNWAQDRDKIVERVISLFPDHWPDKDEINNIGKR